MGFRSKAIEEQIQAPQITFVKNLLCNGNIQWMELKVLHGNTDANKEPLCISV